MLKMVKENKNKALSSYLLSGINIRKMITDESVFPQNVSNISEFNVIKISKRPIFKIQPKEMKDRDQDLNNSNLTNKTFKIRSFTKKLRNDFGVNVTENHQIFQKVTNLRNLRSVSNRIELFNISALSKVNKNESKDCKKQSVQITEKGQVKVHLFGKEKTSIKCKVGSQIFIRQPLLQNEQKTQKKQLNQNIRDKCTLEYHNFQTQQFREMASKIHYWINQKYTSQKSSITIILSLDCLAIHTKRVVKSNSFMQQQNGRCQKRGKFSFETIELIKLLCCNSFNHKIKLMFKVNNAIQLQQLKGKLQANQIEDYFCIFYSNRKYIETWDFYIVDTLVSHQQLILIQNYSELNYSFPILSSKIKTLFIITHHTNFMALSRIIRSIKSFLYYQMQSQQREHSQLNQSEENIFQQSNLATQTFSNDLSYLQAHIEQFHLNINVNQLKARFDLINESKQIKALKIQRGKKSSSSSQRRVLCDRTNNLSIIQEKTNKDKEFNHHQSKQRSHSIHKTNLEEFGSILLDQFRRKSTSKVMEVCINLKGQNHCKNEEVDQITNYVNGVNSKSKSINQIIGELTKKNEHISKQIGQFTSKTDYLSQDILNSIIDNDCKDNKVLSAQQIRKSIEKIIIYKIY